MTNPELGDLLEEFGRLAKTPPRLTEALLREVSPAQGGLITEEDVRTDRPTVVAPRAIELGEWTALTSPRLGGQLISVIADRIFHTDPQSDEAAEAVRLAEASRLGHQTRQAAAGRGSTTHLSVLDSHGGMAALTLTNGEGAGHVLDSTGVHVNNFLGEEDLNPAGFHRHPPGVALPTMIAPTIVLHQGRPRLALGSGGSNRIRSVVSQVLVRVVRGEPLEHAVLAPRIHAEQQDVWLELTDFDRPDRVVQAVARSFGRVHPFEGPDFFFGGVHAVMRDRDNHSHAVGDPRRSGSALVL